LKPDLIAPGERILSCSAGAEKARYGNGVMYSEQSGTSAAAPHVSGAVAAFLSVRREFIGQPEKVKAIFTGAAMDIQRDPYSQGRGLLDLNKALQSV
jgi:subtilisin family serine protease